MDKFKIGDYVRVAKGQRILTGRIESREPFGTQQRYSVLYDETANDTEFLQSGLHYEEELEKCDPPKRI